MCIDWTEIFIRIFLISPQLKIHVSCNDVLHQLVNNILKFQKRFYLTSGQKYVLKTDSPVGHKPYPNDDALRNVRYSWCLSTAGTTQLFMQSVNSTNITVYALQCVTVMNQDTSQHLLPGSTSTPLSHKRLHLTNCLVWPKGRHCADALILLYVYFLSQFFISVFEGGKRVRFTFISLLW